MSGLCYLPGHTLNLFTPVISHTFELPLIYRAVYLEKYGVLESGNDETKKCFYLNSYSCIEVS